MTGKTCTTCRQALPADAYASARARRCVACTTAAEAAALTAHRCVACKQAKPLDEFATPNAKRCHACAAAADDRRRCRTCRVLKVPGAFATPQSRRCRACHRKAQLSPCRNCGQPAGARTGGMPRAFCLAPACQAAKNEEMVRRQVEVRAERVLTRTAKQCPGCGEVKPLTSEHWSPGGRAPRPSRAWDSYCKPCRAAIEADRRRTDDDHRKRQLARKRQHADAVRQRRAIDPAFDELMRARQRKWEGDRRERARTGRDRRAKRQRTRQDATRFPTLPAEPLWLAVMEIIERKGGEGMQVGICSRAGIADRQLRAWAPGGEVDSVQFDTADRVISRLDLEWWNVYGPEHGADVHAAAVRAWAGDDETAVAS